MTTYKFQHTEHTIASTQEQEVQSDAQEARAPEDDILGDLLSPLGIEGPTGVSESECLSEDAALVWCTCWRVGKWCQGTTFSLFGFEYQES